MTERLLFRPAEPQDAEAIVTLVRGSFSPERLETTIYGSDGVGAFLRLRMALPSRLRDTRSLIAVAESAVTGFCELRLADTVFLNYICVETETQGAGLGRKLLARALRSEPVGCERMTLDVFADNARARAWYTRLGFVDETTTDWLGASLGQIPAAEAGRVEGWPQAEASQRAFGFSEFVARTDLGKYTVGRLGTKWFRVPTPEAWADRDLLGTLRRIDAHRGLLAPMGAVARGALTLRVHRMTAPIATVLCRLEGTV
jgi:ribosomal protein S18 acetylase RimI-like enzyme